MRFSELSSKQQDVVRHYIITHIHYYQTVELEQSVHCEGILHVGEIIGASYAKSGVYKDRDKVVADSEDSLIDYLLKVIH
jgi:hypothetical protein